MLNTVQVIEQQYFTKQQACLYTGLSERTIDYARERGEVEFYKVGKRVLLKKQSLDAYIERHRSSADLDAVVASVMADLAGAGK